MNNIRKAKGGKENYFLFLLKLLGSCYFFSGRIFRHFFFLFKPNLQLAPNHMQQYEIVFLDSVK